MFALAMAVIVLHIVATEGIKRLQKGRRERTYRLLSA